MSQRRCCKCWYGDVVAAAAAAAAAVVVSSVFAAAVDFGLCYYSLFGVRRVVSFSFHKEKQVARKGLAAAAST